MNRRVWLWIAGALAVLLILAVWALRQPTEDRPTTPTVKPVHHKIRARSFELPPEDSTTSNEFTGTDSLSSTNAADLYRRAFAMFDGFTTSEKEILKDWQTNVDAAVTGELCEKVLPLRDLVRTASLMTNCDWGLERPLRFEATIPHLAPARNLARATVWSAAHCRDGAEATQDIMAVIRLGRQVDSCALLGSLVDIAIENTALSCVASNLTRFTGKELLDLLSDTTAEELPSRALLMEAEFAEAVAAKLATMSPQQASDWVKEMAPITPISPDQPVAEAKAVAAANRELAGVLATGSFEQYQEWLQRHTAQTQSNTFAAALMPAYESYLKKVQVAVIKRTMVAAALAGLGGQSDANMRFPDPVTGAPFNYAIVPGGFELQSQYRVNDNLVRMFFPTKGFHE